VELKLGMGKRKTHGPERAKKANQFWLPRQRSTGLKKTDAWEKKNHTFSQW